MRKIELHAHTAEVSSCGKLPAREQARLFCEAGYETMVVTDHLGEHWHDELPETERVERYLTGYRAAREAGEALGLHVLLGSEVRLNHLGSEDFLVFGLREADIAPLMACLDGEPTLAALHAWLQARGLPLVQAHPFRKELRPMPPEYLDGLEVYNGNPRHDNHNWLANQYALREHLRIRTSGSDAHQLPDVGRGGILAEEPIADNAALLALLRADAPLRLITTE